jgi:hypothetical protein
MSMPDITPDQLRAAAKRIRDRAVAIPSPGPWRVAPIAGYTSAALVDANGFYVAHSPLPPEAAEFIASMGPDVAVALADALDVAADWLSVTGDSHAHAAVRSCGRQLAALLAPAVKESPG